MLVHVRFSSITMYQAIKQLYRTSGKLIIQCIEDNGFITCTKQINQATCTEPAAYGSSHLHTNNRVLSFFFFLSMHQRHMHQHGSIYLALQFLPHFSYCLSFYGLLGLATVLCFDNNGAIRVHYPFDDLIRKGHTLSLPK